MADYQPAKLKPRSAVPAPTAEPPPEDVQNADLHPAPADASEPPSILPPPGAEAAADGAADEAQRRKDLKRQLVLNQLEQEAQESGFSRLARSKSFWYGVFGALFLLTMVALIVWAMRDIGWIGPR